MAQQNAREPYRNTTHYTILVIHKDETVEQHLKVGYMRAFADALQLIGEFPDARIQIVDSDGIVVADSDDED